MRSEHRLRQSVRLSNIESAIEPIELFGVVKPIREEKSRISIAFVCDRSHLSEAPATAGASQV